MSTRVKICGITNLDDALAAVAAGADALGLNFYEGIRAMFQSRQRRRYQNSFPPFVMRAGVFVNADEDLVTRAICECGLSLLQFHGDEKPEFCTQFSLMSMKAFRIRDTESLRNSKLPTDAYLLDAFSPEARGGTGEKFNWDLAIEAQKFGKPASSPAV